MTGSYFVNRALRKLGAIDPGRSASASELQDGLDTLNHWVETLALSKRLLPAAQIYRQTFPSSKLSYTIGTGGDFNFTRPVEIFQANIVYTQTSPEVHLPVTLLTTREYLGIQVPLIQTNIPIKAYYDQQFVSTPGAAPALASVGLGTIYFNPYPIAPLPDFEFAAKAQLAQFDATTDYLFPPGYAGFIEWSLASEMLEFAPPELDSERVRRMAALYESKIAWPNSRPPRLTPDIGLGSSRGPQDFNWLTGNLG